MAEVVLVPEDMSEVEVEHMFYAAEIEVRRVPRRMFDQILLFLADSSDSVVLEGRKR